MQANLFTSNFKRIKAIASVVVFCILVGVIGHGFNYVLVNDNDRYTRIMMNEFYNQDNIDVLFLGSSHCYFSLNPSVTDKIFEKNTFNAGTSGQFFDGSYALLKEADKLYDLEEVYFEVYYKMAVDHDRSTRTEHTHTYIISDYIKNPIRRFLYICSASKKEYWINGWFPARRYWSSIFDGERIKTVIGNKKQLAYKNFEYIKTEKDEYSGKGFVSSSINNTPFYSETYTEPVDEEAILEGNKKDLENIINYCNKHNIKLTLFASPMPEFRVYNIGNYDHYIDTVKGIAQENGVKYYDFNLCKEEYFPNDEKLFMDKHHLNKWGAEKFSKLFSEFFTGQIREEDLFYNSFDEKMKDLPFRILGHYDYLQEDDRAFEITDNHTRDEEYRFTKIVVDENGDESTPVVIQDYSESRIVDLADDEHGRMIVEHREKGTNNVEKVEYTY